MNAIKRAEARILKTHNILITLSNSENESLAESFCGSILTINEFPAKLPSLSKKTVYLCGDISKADDLSPELQEAERVFIIRELSHGYDENDSNKAGTVVGWGRVPILIHGVGIYFRRFFDSDLDYFNKISEEHVFQSLTESTKPGTAHRTGIYLTPIIQDGEDLHFRLLRCSTNLSGPTDNFRATDRHIVDALNQEAACLFQDQAPLNHVLAQIYHNHPATSEQKQTKARIKAHADKTKDMPDNGIMAFCTFYDQLDKLHPLTQDPFDYGAKSTSGLTKLKFRLKASIADNIGDSLPDQFTVTLYPDSVFFMPLSTNRLYTHEIQPSTLSAEKLPKRLGYVVRCSAAEAVHTNNRTFLKRNGTLMPLQPPSQDGMTDLRKLYAEENKTETLVNYGDKFLFSMNQGDYSAPEYHIADEFRSYTMSIEGNIYEELMASAQFEGVNHGRQGTVLVKPDSRRGTPIVRTTTRYGLPAQCFQTVHMNLAQQIRQRASIPTHFNNALLEAYTNTYAKMGAHSDQALDLEDDSFIAIFSCYQYPDRANPPRKLVVESKDSSGGQCEIPLTHNSVVVFSLDTNQRFKHKIVLDKSSNPPENQWLGITFRTSKTFVRLHNKQICFEDGTPLTLASNDQSREFYSLRSQENKKIEFTYPRVAYTISESDLILPKPAESLLTHLR